MLLGKLIFKTYMLASEYILNMVQIIPLSKPGTERQQSSPLHQRAAKKGQGSDKRRGKFYLTCLRSVVALSLIQF